MRYFGGGSEASLANNPIQSLGTESKACGQPSQSRKDRLELPGQRHCSVDNYEPGASRELPLSRGTRDTYWFLVVYLHRTCKSLQSRQTFGKFEMKL